MRQGYKVIDVDTHVTPSSEVLLRYADEELADRADELIPFTRRTKPVAGRGHPDHEYGVIRVNPYPFERMAGRKLGDASDDAEVTGAVTRRPHAVRSENGTTHTGNPRNNH